VKVHVGYYITQGGCGRSTYHLSEDEKVSLCGNVGKQLTANMGWERAALTPEKVIARVARYDKNKYRRFCKSCLKLLERYRDAIQRLGEVS
jgi:hypothetical protein